MAAARRPALTISSTSLSGLPPRSRSWRAKVPKPSTAVIMLFTSWATPPASRPTEPIRSTCLSRSSTRLRSLMSMATPCRWRRPSPASSVGAALGRDPARRAVGRDDAVFHLVVRLVAGALECLKHGGLDALAIVGVDGGAEGLPSPHCHRRAGRRWCGSGCRSRARPRCRPRSRCPGRRRRWRAAVTPGRRAECQRRVSDRRCRSRYRTSGRWSPRHPEPAGPGPGASEDGGGGVTKAVLDLEGRPRPDRLVPPLLEAGA